MKKCRSFTRTLMLSSLVLSMNAIASSAHNQEDMIGTKINQNAIQAYWTPERLRTAKELPMPIADETSTTKKAPSTNADASSASGDGALPEVTGVMGQQLFSVAEGDDENVGKDLPVPNARLDKRIPNDMGSYNKYFSSSRLVPITADTSYPYSTVGKLFFTIPGQGNFVCSASVLRPRVVLTAGHCTHKGSGGSGGFYTNFYFVPAYRDGAAPFQGWYPNYVMTTAAWANGGGSVPNEADYSMFQMSDNYVSGAYTKIGSVTGYLGYQTQALASNHATLLGYPCNLDSCSKMHQVNAGNGDTVSPNNVEYGSDMTGGSSGGPWVQNFGAAAVGQTGGNNPSVNRVIGVTSYGYISTAPKVQGSSIPDSRFISLLNSICNMQTGNC